MTSGPTNPARRILYVVNEDYAFLLNRLPMARNAGFEVHVATNVNKGAAAIETEGFILHPIPFRRGGLSPLAAACGRPPIATNAPGCREICIADQTGLLVPIENPQLLAGAILKRTQSPELHARYGAAARKPVEEKRSARIVGQLTVALYNRLTPDAPGSP